MPQLLLILLVALSVVLDACAGDDGDDAPGAFKRSAYDEPLDCDAEGDGPDAKACQLAYYANRERRGHPEESDGAAPLDWDEELARVAREYCASMCEENFDHTDPHGRGIETRLQHAGIFYFKAGENLARGANLYPSEAMALFMDEPPCWPNHRGIILDNDFTHTGAGAAACRGDFIYTQLFATFDENDLRDDPNEFCVR